MPRTFRWVLGGLAALVSAAPGAAREHRLAPADAVRWIAPADGSVLRAGEPVTFAWERGAGFARLGAAREWELFLSLDGGRTWAVRLTPHLDLSRTVAEVRLPDLVSSDARLLLRVGDERIEHETEPAVRLELLPARSARLRPVARTQASLVRGEPARAGRRGVVLWATAAGASVAHRWTWYAGRETISAAPQWSAARAVRAATLRNRAPRAGFAALALRGPNAEPPLRLASDLSRRDERPHALDPLSAGCRRNV